MERTDIELIAKSTRGDERSQRELYMRYRVRWYMLSLRYGRNKEEADDILQEGLVNIFNDLHQFDHTKGKFTTWSCRVLVNAALRFLKKNAWNATFSDIEEIREEENNEVSVYDQLAEKELISILQELPAGYRIVFSMYAIEGYTHKEIAQALSITEGTSKSQLSKARKMLKLKLESQLIS